jgi:hypothetical protein
MQGLAHCRQIHHGQYNTSIVSRKYLTKVFSPKLPLP